MRAAADVAHCATVERALEVTAHLSYACVTAHLSYAFVTTRPPVPPPRCGPPPTTSQPFTTSQRGSERRHSRCARALPAHSVSPQLTHTTYSALRCTRALPAHSVSPQLTHTTYSALRCTRALPIHSVSTHPYNILCRQVRPSPPHTQCGRLTSPTHTHHPPPTQPKPPSSHTTPHPPPLTHTIPHPPQQHSKVSYLGPPADLPDLRGSYHMVCNW